MSTADDEKIVELLTIAVADPMARTAALFALSKRPTWYLVGQQDADTVPTMFPGLYGDEGVAFSTAQYAVIYAKTMSSRQPKGRSVMGATPDGALLLFERFPKPPFGLRFDMKIVFTMAELRQYNPAPPPDPRPLLAAATTEAGARANTLRWLVALPEWYLVGERDRGDVPVGSLGPDGLEGYAFSTLQAAMGHAQMAGMGEPRGPRTVMTASPGEALVRLDGIGATLVRFDVFQHDLVVPLVDLVALV